MSSPETYGVWDGDPFVYAPGEAWVSYDGKTWSRENSTEVAMKGRVISKEAFDRMFPRLPALPGDAFHSGSAKTKISS